VSREAGFKLGPWEVRPTLRTLSGPEGTVHLEPKVMDVLVYLAERAGEVVTREQFIERVWHGRVVSDEVLSRCISILRTQLGDSSREPRYIQTVSKLGYRLVLPVDAVASPESAKPDTSIGTTAPPPPLAAAPNRTRRALLYMGAGLIALALAWSLVRFVQRVPPKPEAARTAIAVLPFANLSDDAGSEYFSDGLTEELTDRLAQVPGLQVAARTSAFSFKNNPADVRAIAGRLGVGYVLEGSVRKEGEQVRITAQLVDARRGFHVWSQTFDAKLGDLFAVQDEIANAIVAQLGPRLAGTTTPISTAPPTRVMSAYELVLRGRYHLKRRDEAPIRRSITLFQQALELDPAYADAYSDLARAYALLPYYSYEDKEEMFELALATVERGAAVNPAVREAAQDTLAFIHYGRWEWIDAEEAFRRATAAQPGDPNLQQWYSQLLASVGNAAESLKHAQLARQLDVLSPVVNDRLAVAYLWMNQDEQARQQFELAKELGMGPTANPEAYVVLLLRQHDFAKARDILISLQKLFAGANEWIDPFLAALDDPGKRPAAIAAVARAADRHAISLRYQFGAWLYLGESDRAMKVAQELLAERGEFDVEFMFAREGTVLRRHARFGELIASLGLDQYWDRYGWPPMCARREKSIECH
jgi:TolB-like protein/DNA-binding winged helix-turn-helix (wHTH) protein/tetratricopeptide (TPR) repeat protein